MWHYWLSKSPKTPDNADWSTFYDLPEGTITMPECHCGSKISLGKDDHPVFHSTYCPIREDYEQNKIK